LSTSILGTRIRQRRREIGVSQADLARRVGISAPYLNLIEFNKRRIAGGLLRKIADALNLTLEEIDDVSERQLLSSLTELAHDPALRPFDLEVARTNELIGRFPGWARGIAAIARSERDATGRAKILADRMSNDPFLSETVHRMLSRIAAIRSAAEILSEVDDIPDYRRDKFNEIIFLESKALTDTAEALATYLDKAEDLDPTLTPVDEVQAMFDARLNKFQEIEEETISMSGLLTDAQPISRRIKAQDLVSQHLGDTLNAVIDAQSQIKTSAARTRAMAALRDYAVGAILLPIGAFAARARTMRYDIEALSEAFSVEIENICRRLTALSSEDGAPQFGYLRANAAGTIIERLGTDGLSVPRYSAACPLWVLYRAQQSPEAVIRQRAVFPDGARYVFVARARLVGQSGFGKPRHYVTDMVTLNESDAEKTVYAPGAAVSMEEVGPSCRSCPRYACAHRVENPLGD
jgi:predicted transcriptional regulator/DNA-binding XRE family transcriptional regulator